MISTRRRRLVGPGWADCPACGARGYRATLWVHFRETRPLFVRAPGAPYVIDGDSTAHLVASVGGKEAAGNDRWQRHTCEVR
jgi:hypothetical protein